MATITISGTPIPRLAFGIGSLMKWAPNHSHPLPTDSSAEIFAALAAGFRHLNTSDLYTNNDSLGEALRRSKVPRSQIVVSLKLNTYAALGCRGAQHMVGSVERVIEKLGLEGYVDVLQLHFPPRAYVGNLSNREAWRVLEDCKDRGLARIIGVSNWTMADYRDLFDAEDLRHPPQLNEYEFNPFLLSDPKFQELREFERKRGIVQMNYGVLTAISGRLPDASSTALSQTLERLSQQTKLSTADLLLSWAYYRLGGIVVTSSSKAERLESTFQLLSARQGSVGNEVFDEIESAAERDGYGGKVFYGHPHMEKARLESVGKSE